MRAPLFDRRAGQAPGVAHVEPEDGATGIFRDAPVALRLSSPIDTRSLTGETLRVQDSDGPVAGRTQASADGRLVVWRPERPLRPNVLHFVVASGLTDQAGRPLAPHYSRFVPCAFARKDIQD